MKKIIEYLRKKYRLSSEEVAQMLLPKMGAMLQIKDSYYRVIYSRTTPPYRFTAEIIKPPKGALSWKSKCQIFIMILLKKIQKMRQNGCKPSTNA